MDSLPFTGTDLGSYNYNPPSSPGLRFFSGPPQNKLEAKDPDDDILKFVLATKPSHGRIVQFSSLEGTLAYIPAKN